MYRKILGIILSIVGIAGLVLAFLYVNMAVSPQHLNLLFAGGIFGAVSFFTGIWMIPNAAAFDKAAEVNSCPLPE